MSYPVEPEQKYPEDDFIATTKARNDLQTIADFHKHQMNVIFDALSKSSKTILKVECKCDV